MSSIKIKPLQYDYRLAFEVEKELIATHPEAIFVRVDPWRTGLVARVEEKDGLIDVSSEISAYLNRKLEHIE